MIESLVPEHPPIVDRCFRLDLYPIVRFGDHEPAGLVQRDLGAGGGEVLRPIELFNRPL